MDKDYWLNKWNLKDIAFHEEDVNADLVSSISKLNMQPGNTIFVPLCGKTRDMLWLADKGFKVIGVELSDVACRDFFAELNIAPHIEEQTQFTKYQYNNIELLCGDFFALQRSALPAIHAVYDCKALIALPPELRKKYVDHLVTCLETHIKILLLTRETHSNVNPPPYPVDSTEVNLLYSPYFTVEQLKALKEYAF